MITEIILGIVILILLVDKYLTARDVSRQNKVMLKAIMSKNLHEFDSSERIEKEGDLTENMEFVDTAPELVPLSELNDDEYEKFMTNQLEGESN